MTPAGPTDTTPAPSRASRCACVADGASLSTEQADARCERGDDRLAPLEQVHRTNTGGARRWRRDVLPRVACVVVHACAEPRSCRMRSADPSASTARRAGARPRAGRACGRQCSCGEAEQHKHAATACVGAAADGESVPSSRKFGDGHGALSVRVVDIRRVLFPRGWGLPPANKTDNLSFVAPFTRSDEPGPF